MYLIIVNYAAEFSCIKLFLRLVLIMEIIAGVTVTL